jgi:hypothetical protein
MGASTRAGGSGCQPTEARGVQGANESNGGGEMVGDNGRGEVSGGVGNG